MIPALQGEQYIIINGVKIKFCLEYLGNYITGIGWDISEIFVTLESVNKEENSLQSDSFPTETSITPSSKTTSSKADVYVSDVTLGWISTNFGEGLNESQETVTWLLEIYYSMAVDEDVEVSCSWDNIYRLSGDIIDYGWKDVKDGKTFYTDNIFFTMNMKSRF